MICRCVIDKSWLMQESRGLKPNWLDEIKSLSRKKANISLHKSLSKFYRKLEVKSLGDNFLRFVCHLFCELAQHQLFSTRMDIYPCVCNGIWIWSMTKKKKKKNEYALWQKTKTRKCRQSTESFPNKNTLIVNRYHY